MVFCLVIAVWGTMVPTSIIVGISASPLWTSLSSYITKIAQLEARLTNTSPEIVVTKFFGIFWGVFNIGEKKILSDDNDLYCENDLLLADLH